MIMSQMIGWNPDRAAKKMIADLVKVVDLYEARYEIEPCPGCNSGAQCENDCWIRALMKKAKVT